MKKPILIGVCGGSGSGKTTFIQRLRDVFSEDELCVISQDNYYKRRDEQHVDENGILNFDLPNSIDEKAYASDIRRLLKHETVEIEEYTFNNSLMKPKLLVFKSAPIVVVEGLFVFYYEEIARMLDLKVLIEAKDDKKIIRRIKRDQIERNYPLDDVLYRYEHHVQPAFERYIRPFVQDVDIIINNNHNLDKGYAIMRAYISSLLHQP